MKSQTITINNVEVPYFVGFNQIEEGFFTKTTLKNEYGLKPLDEKMPDAVAKLKFQGRWSEYYLFNKRCCVEIKKRQVRDLEVTDRILAESLYLINKSAKISRDTKAEKYKEGNFSIVKTAKTREEKLYELKSVILQKLKDEDRADVLGYHCIYGKPYALIKFNDFYFHEPIEETDGLPYLGDILHKIPAARTIGVGVNFYEAKQLLETYAMQSV